MDWVGKLVEQVTDQSLEVYFRENIFAPLGMKDSTLLNREASPQLLTSPHVMENSQVVVSKIFPYNRAHAPSGTLYSSIEDMSRWAIANLNHGELDGQRILKRETAESMWRPVVPALGMKEGISWFSTDVQGHHLVLHSGGDVGFESLLILAPDDSVAVVAMCNFEGQNNHDLNEFVNVALRIMLGTKESTPAATSSTVAPAQLSSEDARKKADEVLASYVTALGGRAAIEKLTSRVSKGNFEVSGIAMSGPVEIYGKAPNFKLTVLQMPGQETFKDGFDGKVGWEQNPDDGITDKTGLDAGSAMRDADFYQPLKLRLQYPNLIFKGTAKVSLGKGGAGKVEERDAFVLEAPRAGSPRRFFFDSANGLLLRTEEWDAAGKMGEADEYQDYRGVDGVKVAFTIHIIQDAHFTIKLTEVKHNLTIDDTIFVKPKK